MNKYEVLKQYFGYTEFRGGQAELIDGIAQGRDVLGIMPTGGGKSLCYQIPALMRAGLTIVISPLISLMKDQVMALKNVNVAAAYVNSTLSYEQLQRVYDQLRNGAYKILYVAPERLESQEFVETVWQLSVSLVAVDEAHCISQWGNDFRPSYLKITDFVNFLPSRPTVAAFTATATEQVRRDIEEKLHLRAPLRVITGFDRSNLNFEVLRPRKKSTELLELIRQRQGASGIVYCMTRNNVEKICALLQEHGFAATRYHAGLEDRERHRNQEDFVYDRKPIMVATNAFGMGIDKSNVSYVIHYNMPMSLEAYYQEAGRAGRDGEAADCLLLYSPSDIYTAKQLILSEGVNEQLTKEERAELQRLDLDRLDRMIEYCKTTKCLRGNILEYFGQSHEDACGNCGNCRTVFQTKDITTEAQKILSCVLRIYHKIGYSVGIALLTRVLRGSQEQRLRELGLQDLSTYGILSDCSREEVGDMIQHLIDLGYAEKEPTYGAIVLTPRAKEVLFDGVRVIMEIKEIPPKEPKKKKKERAQTPVADVTLYDRLRRLRMEIANEQGVPAYIVFSNATLADMASRQPTEPWEFREVLGVGETKAGLYGDRFMEEIRRYQNGE